MTKHERQALEELEQKWREAAEELGLLDVISLTHKLKLQDCADELLAVLRSFSVEREQPSNGETEALTALRDLEQWYEINAATRERLKLIRAALVRAS